MLQPAKTVSASNGGGDTGANGADTGADRADTGTGDNSHSEKTEKGALMTMKGRTTNGDTHDDDDQEVADDENDDGDGKNARMTTAACIFF